MRITSQKGTDYSNLWAWYVVLNCFYFCVKWSIKPFYVHRMKKRVEIFAKELKFFLHFSTVKIKLNNVKYVLCFAILFIYFLLKLLRAQTSGIWPFIILLGMFIYLYRGRSLTYEKWCSVRESNYMQDRSNFIKFLFKIT
jgi:hypothetical protein